MAKKKNKEQLPRELTRRQLSHHKQQQRRQRIILITGITIIAAIIIIVASGWFMSVYRPLQKSVLKVGDNEFSMSYFIDILTLGKNSQPDTSLQELAVSTLQMIEQGEILRQGAEKLGVTVKNEEVVTTLDNLGIPVTESNKRFISNQVLNEKVRGDYFGNQIPQKDKQVNSLMMMVESEQAAREVREKLASGDNFTALAEQFAQNYYSKNVNKGEFGWHPSGVLEDQLGTKVPIDFAFGAAPGTWSQPLADNATFKQLGYWLLNVRERSAESTDNVSANVSALYIADRAQAGDIKARLEAGEDLGALADKYTQYSPSRDKRGELGRVIKPVEAEKFAVSSIFDSYVFSENTTLGKWSDPIRDDTFWTQGGSWLVKVLETEDSRQITEEDRDFLIEKAFNDWITKIFNESNLEIDNTLMTNDMQQWAIDRVTKKLGLTQG